MTEKRCFKCGELKPLDDFYGHPQMADGRVNKCKECNKVEVKINRQNKREFYLEYDRKRAVLPHRVEARQVYNSIRPEVSQRAKGKWIERNPEKRQAQNAVNNAIRKGRLIRRSCEICGGRAHAHHDDYSKPFDVRWLCPKHHSEHHKNERRASF